MFRLPGRGVGGDRPQPAPLDVELPTTAESFDPSEAELIGQTEFSDTYRNDDGTNTMILSAEPLNARVDGQWVDVNTTVSDDPDLGWSAEAHPLQPEFADEADADDLLSVERAGYEVSFSLDGAAAAYLEQHRTPRSIVGADEVTYEEVFDGVDLTYEVVAAGVKESLVLSELPAVGENSWTWTVDAPGLSLVINEFGDIDLVDAGGTVRMMIPAPIMWDSSGVEGESESASAMVDTTVVKQGDSWALTLTAERSWLADQDRTYPVFVDPTLQIDSPDTDFHAYKSDGATRSDAVHMGNTRENQTDRYWRTVVKYDYSALSGRQVLNAEMGFDFQSGVEAGRYGAVNHATGLGFYNAGVPLGGFYVGTGVGYNTDSRLAAQYSQWVNVGEFGAYLMISGEEQPGYGSYKQLDSWLSVVYKDFPSVVSYNSPSPANAATKAPVMPTFKLTGADPYGYGLHYRYQVSTTADFANPVYDSQWLETAEHQVPASELDPATTYYWRGGVRDMADGHLGTSTLRWGGTRTFTTNVPAPTPPQLTAIPADGATETSLTPAFSVDPVTDTDSAVTVHYQFRIATGPDGKTGAIVSSGWLDTNPATGKVEWTPPVGTLQDGGSYTWVVVTDDGIDKAAPPSWVNKLKINLRLGTTGPSPYDAAGPVTVNLANGNVSLGFSSPTVNTVGGPMGLSFAYNSQQSPTRVQGLTGSYYNALTPGQTTTSSFVIDGKPTLLVRTDPMVSFAWGMSSPGPAMPVDYFMARWDGFINLPTAGNYAFGVTRDDGVKVWVNNEVVVDQWNTAAAPLTFGPSKPFQAGPTKIQLDYYEATGSAGVDMWVRTPSGQEFPVPADWFTTSVQTLPGGWSTSTPINGSGGVYASAKVSEGSVILTDITGSVHTYVKTPGGSGGYTAPTGEYGILTLDSAGLVTLVADDGTVYAFNVAGKVASVTSPADAMKPASPIIQYRPNGVVDRISDPVSVNVGTNPPTYSREVRFAYEGDSAAAVGLSAADSDMSGTACPVNTGAGYGDVPDGMLCRIIYPGHVPGQPDTTQLHYNPNGQLAMIQDPGYELTSFGYDGAGRLAAIIDSLGADWLMTATPTQVASSIVTTNIGYDSEGRAEVVVLPAPDGATSAARPYKIYTYATKATPTTLGTTHVDVGGLTGHANTVTYDSAWRQRTATSAMGLTSTQVWNAKDQVESTTDPQGVMSTTIYDPKTDRVTDTYGPAPVACFGTNRLPLSSCPVTPAHTSTAYDQGLLGLHAAYYNNKTLTGAPKRFNLGLVDITSGAIDKDWGTAAPLTTPTGFPGDGWSVRMTGLITFPTPGTYTVQTLADDGTRVWIDDVLKINHWVDGAATPAPTTIVTTTANEPHRIRLEYYDLTGPASLKLQWKTPGSGTFVTVPGQPSRPTTGSPTASPSRTRHPPAQVCPTPSCLTPSRACRTRILGWVL